MNKQSLIEALKEIGRIVLLALIAYLLTEGVLDGIVSYFGGSLDAITKAEIIGLATTLLRSLDKYLHEIGKQIGDSKLVGGITRF